VTCCCLVRQPDLGLPLHAVCCVLGAYCKVQLTTKCMAVRILVPSLCYEEELCRSTRIAGSTARLAAVVQLGLLAPHNLLTLLTVSVPACLLLFYLSFACTADVMLACWKQHHPGLPRPRAVADSAYLPACVIILSIPRATDCASACLLLFIVNCMHS
jgi:hypothetical protein